MGKKKGKSKAQDESNTEGAGESVPAVSEEEKLKVGDDGGSVPTPKPGGGKKGKKDRKKKALEEAWDEDFDDVVEESGLSVGAGGEGGGGEAAADGPSGGEEGVPLDEGGEKKKELKLEGDVQQEDKQQQQQQQAQPVQQEVGSQPAASASGGGKAGKKKRKKNKELAEWEDDVERLAREIEGEGAAVEETGRSETQTSHSPSLEPHGDHTTEVPNTETGAENETGAVATEERTKSEKKAAAKKRKKEASKQKGKASGTVTEQSQTAVEGGENESSGQKQSEAEVKEDPSASEPVVQPAGAEGGTQVGEKEGDGEGEGEGEEGDDKKKKKKKKKKPAEEEKKSKTKKPAKSAILKMKEQIEFMRAEQKRREEEERARQLAEEEARRREEEEARLEQERKEKKKQKEKERRERRKKEGKPVTKAEKEKYAKAQAMLQVMKDQGLQIPARATERGEGAPTEKGKVRYGRRQRPKKTQLDGERVEKTEEVVEEESGQDSMMVAVAGGEAEEEETQQEDEVKMSWEEMAEEEDDVKECWEDEDDEPEEEDTAKTAVKPDSQVQQLAVTGSPTTREREGGEEGDEEGEGEGEGSSEESSESESEEEELTAYEKAERRIEVRRKRHREEMSLEYLRSPVVCVLGHVDTGKTKILDKIRHTNVQDGEAGGITQQIGATFVPEDAIRTQTKMVKEFSKTDIKLPGLLIIDTPGHESFSNLRSRGSSMCDLAILVVDIMHGLEPQTLESLGMLRKGKTPFVVALNKIDRLFDWRRMPTSSVRETVKKQKVNTRDEFEERVRGVVTEFAEQAINAALFWEKVDFTEYIPLVPTSAHTGDGMGDLISLLVNYSQKVLAPKLMLSQELEAVVLEVKVIAGLGTTIDVILRNGILKEGDTLVLTGTEGPFTTQVRALLMPQPLRELRVKNAYVNHKAIVASQGVKITAKDLEKTLAGTPIFVAKKADEIEVLKDEASRVVSSMLSAIQLQERGVYVQASTLGSLEALLAFLKQSKIPYSGVNIGPVHKRDVMKASVMLEHDSQWAVILAFDVRVERDAQEMADNLGVKVFTADIIYHLFDNFLQHRKELRDQKRREYESIAIFPCKLRILPNCVFNTRDPIVVGVVVEAGLVKRGTILTVPSKGCDVGVISSLEVNHKSVDIAHKGEEVCIKIEPTGGEAPKLYGRHFDSTDLLISKVSRESIDAVKNYFREDLQKSDWQLFIELKKIFHII